LPAGGLRRRAACRLAMLAVRQGRLRPRGDTTVPLARLRLFPVFRAGVRAAQQRRDRISDLLLAGVLAQGAAGVVPGKLPERERCPAQVLPEHGDPAARAADVDAGDVVGVTADLPQVLLLCDP